MTHLLDFARLRFVGIAAATCWLVGCTALPEPAFDTSPLRLPTARRSPDSLVFEIGFVRVPDDREFEIDVWSELDEQVLPPDLRRRLSANGLRCGVVSAGFPAKLRKILDQRFHKDGGLSEVDQAQPLGEQLDDQNRRLQLRAGKSGEIVASNHDRLVLLRNTEDSVSGQTYFDAQTKFTLTGIGNGDGSIQLQLVPEIHHGQAKSKFVGRDGAFRLEASRQCVVFDDLGIDVTLSPGQSLALTCSEGGKSLGGNFFHLVQERQKKLLLIRLAQSQADELFTEADANVP